MFFVNLGSEEEELPRSLSLHLEDYAVAIGTERRKDRADRLVVKLIVCCLQCAAMRSGARRGC